MYFERPAQDADWYQFKPPCDTWKEQRPGQAAPVLSYVDPWEVPLDELIRSREEAVQVYEQMNSEILASEQTQNTQYQPVVCDNQQYYTDGQGQLYMLACITGSPTGSEGAEAFAVTD